MIIMEKDFPYHKEPDRNVPDKNFWESKWANRETGWDIGYPSPAIEKYILQYPDKEASILIPGCGNAYEAAFLWNLGFKNITVLDIASKAVEILKNNRELMDKLAKHLLEKETITGEEFQAILKEHDTLTV